MLDPRIKANWKRSNEMARVNVNILGIRELKWTGMGDFNSDKLYIYYCGQKSLRRNGVAIIVNKRVLNTVLGCSLKNDRMISVCFQGKPFKYIWLECKSRKSRNTWSNRQIWAWNVEWSRAKTNRVLPRKCTGHSKYPLPAHRKIQQKKKKKANLNQDPMRRGFCGCLLLFINSCHGL